MTVVAMDVVFVQLCLNKTEEVSTGGGASLGHGCCCKLVAVRYLEWKT